MTFVWALVISMLSTYTQGYTGFEIVVQDIVDFFEAFWT